MNIVAGAGGAVVVGMLAFAMAGSVVVGSASGNPGQQIGGGKVDPSKIPNGWGEAVQAAGDTCPTISAPILAAQLEAESGWDPNAVSPVGAEGLAQFMPATWKEHGVDGDGDGVKDPFNPFDAIPSMAAFDCWLWTYLESKGLQVTTQLVLAAYNAGPGAVVKHDGIPPYDETQTYVAKIMRNAAKYGTVLTPDSGLVEGERAAVIAHAKKWIGTPYSWGGGGINGPSRGFAQGKDTVGFDCSSLMLYAYYHGSSRTLPRVSRDQAKEGVGISRADLQPGDLIFFAPSKYGTVNHVGMWLGEGKMIHAPRTGKTIEISTIVGNSYWEGKSWTMRRLLDK